MEIELVRFFVKVVQNGSFTRAAEALRLPKSTVSKAISRLERETGTKLLLRTTRSLTLTPAGRAFYESCLGPLQSLEDAQRSLYGQDSILTGRFRLTAPEDLGYQIVAPAIAELSRKHPKLTFELAYTNQVLDLVKDGFDLAVRLGRLPESGLRARRLGEVVLVPVASPKYLKGRTPIRTPRDLEDHDGLAISSVTRIWPLRRHRESVRVHVPVKIESNHMTSILRMALAGAGIAFVPNYLCQDDVAAGRLVRVLAEWSGVGYPVSLVSPLAPAASARLRLVSDHLATALGHVLQSN